MEIIDQETTISMSVEEAPPSLLPLVLIGVGVGTVAVASVLASMRK